MLRHLEACGFPAERPVSEAPLTVADGHPVAVTTFVDGAPPAPTHATWIAVAELAGRLASLPVPPAAVEGAPDLADLPRGLVHPDLLLPNVLDAPGELVVIDWAGAGVGPRALALGGLLRFGALEPDGWSVRRFQAMLDAFERHALLAPDERARVPQLVQHKALVMEAFGFAIGMRLGGDPLYAGQWSTLEPHLDDLADLLVAR